MALPVVRSAPFRVDRVQACHHAWIVYIAKLERHVDVLSVQVEVQPSNVVGVHDPTCGAREVQPGDSGPSEGLAPIAREADLFVCEATLQQPNPEGGTRGHLSSQEAIEAFEASGAKRLLLTHRPFERPLEEQVELAHDGLQIQL